MIPKSNTSPSLHQIPSTASPSTSLESSPSQAVTPAPGVNIVSPANPDHPVAVQWGSGGHSPTLPFHDLPLPPSMHGGDSGDMEGLPSFHHFNLAMSHVSPLPSVAHQPPHPPLQRPAGRVREHPYARQPQPKGGGRGHAPLHASNAPGHTPVFVPVIQDTRPPIHPLPPDPQTVPHLSQREQLEFGASNALRGLQRNLREITGANGNPSPDDIAEVVALFRVARTSVMNLVQMPATAPPAANLNDARAFVHAQQQEATSMAEWVSAAHASIAELLETFPVQGIQLPADIDGAQVRQAMTRVSANTDSPQRAQRRQAWTDRPANGPG